jgi:hypothetical protein
MKAIVKTINGAGYYVRIDGNWYYLLIYIAYILPVLKNL